MDDTRYPTENPEQDVDQEVCARNGSAWNDYGYTNIMITSTALPLCVVSSVRQVDWSGG
jgi:hypothetical protein